MTTEQNQLRATFDDVALLYDQVRPGYPDALFDDVIALSQIPSSGHILEIGCGTGQATIPFARRGYHIHCIELGANLAAAARQNLALYPNAEVSTGAYETWPIEEGRYDLVISAMAFHWIDPDIRYRKSAQALKPTGSIALFWTIHVQTEVSANFFQTVQAVYDSFAPSLAAQFPGLSHPDTVPAPVKDDIDHTYLFGEVTVLRYLWNMMYDSTGYINLLNTYSDHRILENTIREKLFRGIGQLIDTQFGGHITKEHLTILYLAQRK